MIKIQALNASTLPLNWNIIGIKENEELGVWTHSSIDWNPKFCSKKFSVTVEFKKFLFKKN